MDGSEVFGDESDNSSAWGTMYDKREWTKIKVESGDGSYVSPEYGNNEEYTGNMQMEELLSDKAKIMEKGGANVYVLMNDRLNCYRYDEKTIYGADCGNELI